MKSVIDDRVTYYPARHYNWEMDATGDRVQKFYNAGGQTIAVRTLTNGTDTLNWVLGDHLGSTSLTANADGTWNSTLKYTAFGELRSAEGITPTKFQYTGQLSQMDEIGLYYYVARFYDPYLNHFIQADTIVPQPGMSVAYDRYAYVQWNPIRYNDPTGHYLVEGDWLSPDSGTYSAGYYQYGNTVLLDPEDAALIYGVAIPMRVTWATIIDPNNEFRLYAPGLMLGIADTGKSMPPSSLGLGVPHSVPRNLIEDVIPQENRDPAVPGSIYRGKLKENMKNAGNTKPADMKNPEAHHGLPWKFKDWFAAHGLDVNQAEYGFWVERGQHQKWSRDYNDTWGEFIEANPFATIENIKQFMGQLMTGGNFPSR